MFLLLTVCAARADQQALVYDLSMNGAKVGTREVTVSYLEKNGFERHVVAVHTTIEALGTKIEARTTGTSGSTNGFTSATEINGAREQIQAQQQPDGSWRLITVDGKGAHESTLTRTQAKLSTVDLVDPGRTKLLGDGGIVGILIAETGELLSGTLGAGTESSVTVGGESVPTTHYEVTGSAGTARFDVDENGLLVRSELKWLGGIVTAQLTSIPPRLSDTTVTIDGFDAPVQEEAL